MFKSDTQWYIVGRIVRRSTYDIEGSVNQSVDIAVGGVSHPPDGNTRIMTVNAIHTIHPDYLIHCFPKIFIKSINQHHNTSTLVDLWSGGTDVTVDF